jgi:sec-independent protein translocase protein TatA
VRIEQMVAYSPGPEWIVVLVVLVLLFGAKKLPELARSVGKSTSEFKKGMSEGGSDADADGTSDDADDRAKRKAETSE